MNTKQFNNKRKTVEEVVVRRKIFSESAPDLANIGRPETTDRIYENRSKTHVNYNTATLKPRSKTATTTNISLPSIHHHSSSYNVKQSHYTGKELLSYEDVLKREEDNKELLENVVEYCKMLQARIKELEIEKLEAIEGLNTSPYRDGSNNNGVNSRIHVRNHLGTSSTNSLSPEGSAISTFGSPSRRTKTPDGKKIDMKEFDINVQHSVKELDSRVTSLRYLFKPGDPIKDRYDAAVKIAAIVRGWLARIRMKRFKQGLRDWKWTRTRQVIWLLEILLGNNYYEYIN